ncbi:MAG: response regulator transcription factor [Clostridiales bacterium]|nr:response regulator transcription factor [Clostridiales bacterium]
MAKILMIEDDKGLCEQVQAVLKNYSYEVVIVEDFAHVEELFEKTKPDLILLDINLPRFDGNYYCRYFRRNSNVPIIMTSARNSDMDQILSMELGADDYIVKPFSIPVLLAKINAILRRTSGMLAENTQEKGLQIKGLFLDEGSFMLKQGSESLELSKTEYKLLHCFFEKPDSIITREELLEEIWDMNTFVDDNTLTVNVARVKAKLSELGYVDVIKTKRGSGYRFDTSSIKE